MPQGPRKMPIRFCLNRTCAPQVSLPQFIALAVGAGVTAVEIRNDIEGREFADGTPAAELRTRLDAAGLAVASVNALQRFNDGAQGFQRCPGRREVKQENRDADLRPNGPDRREKRKPQLLTRKQPGDEDKGDKPDCALPAQTDIGQLEWQIHEFPLTPRLPPPPAYVPRPFYDTSDYVQTGLVFHSFR